MAVAPLLQKASEFYWNAHVLKHDIRSYWREIERFKQSDPNKCRSILAKRLHSQLCYFATRKDALPEWKEAARNTDLDRFWEIWERLPILTKDDLRNRFHPESIRSHSQIQGVASSTGGSTGEPTPFLHDEAMRTAKYAAQLYCQMQFGWTPGMPLIQIWGSERDIGKTQGRKYHRLINRLHNLWVVDGYQLTNTTVKRVHDLIHALAPVAIYGFTGLLEYVARHLLESHSMPVPGLVKAAWNGGEMLFENQVSLFDQVFGCPLQNLYGGRELSAMAYQPLGGKSLEVLRPLLFVEIVDDSGSPTAPGKPGRLIWTSTICRGTPFLRYDIGDVGVADLTDRDVAGVRALTALEGRRSGILTLPSGRTIGCIFWNHLFKEYPQIQQFQVALIANRKVELRLKGQEINRECEQKILGVVRKLLDMKDVTIVRVDCIVPTAEGKRLQVVQEDKGIE
jgi:phenylacetate-CoA ligase